MPNMLDMIKASAVPANLMKAAAHGSLTMPAVETLEVLVYLTQNKVFGQQARMTLAAWDLDATQATVGDSKAPQEILRYYLKPENIRPKLLPFLIENPAVGDELLIVLAAEGSRDVVRAMLASARVRASHKILELLSLNTHVTQPEAAEVSKWLSGTELRVVGGTEAEVAPAMVAEPAAAQSGLEPQASAESISDTSGALDCEDESEEAMAALTAFEREHAAELASLANAPFKPIGGTYGLEGSDGSGESAAGEDETAASSPQPAVSPGSGGSAAAAAPAKIKPKVPPKNAVPERVSVLQKIARLDVKGRVQLAVRGSKEERAILVRDGTKLVALAVLQSPKISDGEVEKFAGQKNVLEATLRGITMHRRFMKNYNTVRNLTFNPRTPIDLSLGMIKNLMIQDLKNLSGNKEVSDTVRKMALRGYKQKADATKKS